MGAWHHCAQQLSGNRRTAYWRRGSHPYPAVLEYRLCNRQDNVGGAKLELSNSKSSGGTRRNHYGHRDPGHVHRGYCHVSIFHDRRIAVDWAGIFLRFLYALPLVVHFERELFYLADSHGSRTARLLHCAFRNQGPGRRVEHGTEWCLPSGSSNDTSSHGWRCAQPIPLDILFDTFCDMLILAFLGIGIPFMMAAFAGGGVHMALEHFAAAKYVGGSAMHYLGSAIGGLTHVVQRMAQNSSQQTTLQQRMEAGAAAARASSGTPTTPLAPPPLSGGGWNGRPAGPPIAPPPSGPHNSGPGGSPAGLTYYPGRPGAQTKAEAVDITKLQK